MLELLFKVKVSRVSQNRMFWKVCISVCLSKETQKSDRQSGRPWPPFYLSNICSITLYNMDLGVGGGGVNKSRNITVIKGRLFFNLLIPNDTNLIGTYCIQSIKHFFL